MMRGWFMDWSEYSDTDLLNKVWFWRWSHRLVYISLLVFVCVMVIGAAITVDPYDNDNGLVFIIRRWRVFSSLIALLLFWLVAHGNARRSEFEADRRGLPKGKHQ